MKSLVALCLLAIAALSFAKPQGSSRGYVYALGKRIRECEEGTHSYNKGCSQITPEATCDEPKPQKEQFIICDYSACYCDAPTVRDSASGKCVTLDQCPKK